MLLPLPYLGATVTWTTCGCSQDCRNEASRPAAEESGCGLAAPCSVWLWLGHCISYALANARIYIAAPVSAMPALTQYGPFPWPGFDQCTSGTYSKRGDNKYPGCCTASACCTQCTCPLVVCLQAAASCLPACLLPCLTTPSERSGVSLLRGIGATL